jgi:hypothetical protein
MVRNYFFKQISVDKLVVNFRVSRFSTVEGPFVFVNILADLDREVFIMNPTRGEWKIKRQRNLPHWLFDFECSLSEAINERGGS